MKIITLSLLMIMSVGVARAEVYKCPGKVEGQYIYQGIPCKGAKVDEHTVKIIPTDEKKVLDAQTRLNNEINMQNGQPIVAPPTENRTESSTVSPPPNPVTMPNNATPPPPQPVVPPPPTLPASGY